MSTQQKSTVLAMIIGVAVFHYFIPRELLTLHILFRFLYLVPIMYVALYIGRSGGVVTALFVTLIFLPHFFMSTANNEFIAGNIGAVILFNIVGFFVGNFRDKSEREILEQKQKVQVLSVHKGEGSNILFYVDNTQLATATAEWFTKIFGHAVTALTIFAVYNKDESEKFSSQQAAEEHVSDRKKETALYMESIKKEFTGKGISPDKITIKSVTKKGKLSTSDKILEELKRGNYDLVLLPKHDKTHAQEFLFGDTAVQLLRKASIPILSIKGSFEEKKGE